MAGHAEWFQIFAAYDGLLQSLKSLTLTQRFIAEFKGPYLELYVREVKGEPHKSCLPLVPLSHDLPCGCQDGLRQRNSDNAEYKG